MLSEEPVLGIEQAGPDLPGDQFDNGEILGVVVSFDDQNSNPITDVLSPSARRHS
jgi:hypothetical protein